MWNIHLALQRLTGSFVNKTIICMFSDPSLSILYYYAIVKFLYTWPQTEPPPQSITLNFVPYCGMPLTRHLAVAILSVAERYLDCYLPSDISCKLLWINWKRSSLSDGPTCFDNGRAGEGLVINVQPDGKVQKHSSFLACVLFWQGSLLWWCSGRNLRISKLPAKPNPPSNATSAARCQNAKFKSSFVHDYTSPRQYLKCFGLLSLRGRAQIDLTVL
jgi:hypothetical protein